MKTICVIDGRIVMSQDGNALETMTANAAQYPGATVSVVSDEQYAGILASETHLTDRVNAAVLKTYRDVDAIYADAVGNRTPEYTAAEVDAQSYKDAGYAGTVPDSVQCFADHNPTMAAQTPQWAADQILARAAALRAAQSALRSGRFAWQEAMRAATTPEELATAVAGWNALVASTRASLWL